MQVYTRKEWKEASKYIGEVGLFSNYHFTLERGLGREGILVGILTNRDPAFMCKDGDNTMFYNFFVLDDEAYAAKNIELASGE